MVALTIKNYAGGGIGKHLEALARLRIRVFRDYPCLYDGTLSYEKKYLKMYQASPRSFIALCFDGNKIVGATTCLPLMDAEEDFRRPFIENKYDPKSVFTLASPSSSRNTGARASGDSSCSDASNGR